MNTIFKLVERKNYHEIHIFEVTEVDNKLMEMGQSEVNIWDVFQLNP